MLTFCLFSSDHITALNSVVDDVSGEENHKSDFENWTPFICLCKKKGILDTLSYFEMSFPKPAAFIIF